MIAERSPLVTGMLDAGICPEDVDEKAMRKWTRGQMAAGWDNEKSSSQQCRHQNRVILQSYF